MNMMTKQHYPAGWELVERCEREMSAEGRTAKALKSLRNRVRFLLRYLEEQGIDIRHLQDQDCWEYQRWLLEIRSLKTGEPMTRSSVLAMMTCAGLFCSYLVKWGILLDNPMRRVKKVRIEKTIPYDILKEAEMEEFLERLGAWESETVLKQKAYRYRAHVMAELQYASGIRLEELGDLKETDVDWERGVLTVRRGKGYKERTAFLNSYAVDVLKRWVQMRPLVLREEDVGKDRLFGAYGTTLEHTYNAILTRVAGEMNRPNWTSHKIRHALGYHLLRAGCKLRNIQTILGHTKIGTTEVYTRVDEKDSQAVLDACHPRAMP
jgi:integrase/recombinase XerC